MAETQDAPHPLVGMRVQNKGCPHCKLVGSSEFLLATLSKEKSCVFTHAGNHRPTRKKPALQQVIRVDPNRRRTQLEYWGKTFLPAAVAT